MIRSTLLVCISLLLSAQVSSAEMNETRAKYNYQMFCQGCHTQDGMGGRAVPQLKGFIGHFPKSQKGREYLIRVPGSANSVLNDLQLAEVLNWMIINFGENSVAANWRPYDVDEVSELRKNPLMEVLQYRKDLVAELTSQNKIMKVENE